MLGAIFLGVPHDGSRLTSVGKLMSYTTYWLGSSTQLLESLQPRDESLRELNASFLQGYGRRDLINFFERHMTRMGQFPLLLVSDSKPPLKLKCWPVIDRIPGGRQEFQHLCQYGKLAFRIQPCWNEKICHATR